jgi:hypothetical protein
MLLRRHKAFGLGLLFAVALSIPAFAQPTATGMPYPEKSCTKAIDSEKAHNIYTAGKADYDDKDYDRAIVRFHEAYRLDCTKHELLIIISAAWEKKGEKSEAARALEAYLDRAQNLSESDRGTYQRGLDKLREEARKKALANAPPTATSTSTAPPPNGEGGGHTVLPWIAAGAGVVGVGIGITLLAVAPEYPENQGCDKDARKCTPLPGETEQSPSFKDRQEKAGRATNLPLAGTILLAVGGALIVGGLLWHFLEPTDTKSAKLRIQPALVPGYGGLSLTRSF